MLKIMEFTIELYVTVGGGCPVREFLDALKVSDPADFATVLAGLVKLRNRHYHREPLAKPLGGGLFELRHVRNKGQAMPARDIQTALARKQDWMARTQV